MKLFRAFVFGSIGLLCHSAHAAPEPSASKPYTIVKTAQVMGTGGIDYVFADSAERMLYVPRGNDVLVFDIDSLAPAGTIQNVRARGVAVDPKSNHGFASSSPVAMWDAKSLAVLKTTPWREGRTASFTSRSRNASTCSVVRRRTPRSSMERTAPSWARW